MNKREISEIKRTLTPANCAITRICGCYVDGEKNKKSEFTEAFLALPEDDMFKYFDILRKILSGQLGKNLLNIETPVAENQDNILYQLRKSELKDQGLLNEFYDRIIDSYYCSSNYLILLVIGIYDIPGKCTDEIDMEDVSEYVYRHIMCAICPVDLAKPALSYNEQDGLFENRLRDWIVDKPDVGFLYPVFNDRSTDIHNTLFYTKSDKELQTGVIKEVLSGNEILSAVEQKDTFVELLEDIQLSFEQIKLVNFNLNEMIEDYKGESEILVLDKELLRKFMVQSNLDIDQLKRFDESYGEIIGENTILIASNIADTKNFKVELSDIKVQINPYCIDDISVLENADGKYLTIKLSDGDSVTVNGACVNL